MKQNKRDKAPKPDFNELIPILIGVWRRFHKLAGPADRLQTREFRSVVEAVQLLRAGLETGTALVGTDYFSQPNLLGAYLLYQWIIHYQEGLALLKDIPDRHLGRVLDIGSGPGAYSYAALQYGAKEVIAIDKQANALKLAGEVCGRSGYPLTVRKQDALNTNQFEGFYDLIIVGHCLQELFPDTQKGWRERQFEWVKRLLKKLTPTGHLLIVDNSQIHANQRVLELRDLVAKDNLPIAAPCIWKGECPALQAKNSPCYAQKELEKPYLVKEIQRAAEINLGSLKMSYLLLNQPEALIPLDLEHPLYRVISPPVETQFGKRYYLCGTDGKKNLGSRMTEFPPESRAFEYLRRGSLIEVENAEERGNQFDIVLGTKIILKS